DLSLEERDSVRTPMQWSHRENGGFSSAAVDELVRRPVEDGPFSFREVNVAAQLREPESLLNWVQRTIRARHLCAELGRGEPRFFDVDDDRVLAHACASQASHVLVLHNLADEALSVRL